ncbi:VanZ family protein [Flavobacteriaceae bacterium SZ-1-7]|uniref:VanZ family protein n=1 Tax=Tamlana sedimenti TaxID=3134126 RepID=UPI00312671FB
MLKKVIFFLTLTYTLVLTLVCLVRLNNLPDIGVSFGDKIFHFLAYVVLTILWFGTWHYRFGLKTNKSIVYALVFAIIFGIIIEVLQDTLTDYRTLDAHDIFANSLGALLASIVLWFKGTLQVKNS